MRAHGQMTSSPDRVVARSDQPDGPGEVLDRVLTLPNALSLGRLAMVPVFVWLFVTNHENVAVLLYCAAAWTDFFDGFLARKMGVVSKLGQLLDPFSDRVLIIALVVALVVRRALPWWLAAVLVARDVLLLAAWPIWEKKGVERIAVNMVGKTATAALFFGLTWLAFDETSFTWAQSGHAIGMPFVIFGAVLYWVAGGIYAQEARHKLASAPAAGSL